MPANEPTADELIKQCDSIQEELSKEVVSPCAALSEDWAADHTKAATENFQRSVAGYRDRYRELSYKYFNRFLERPSLLRLPIDYELRRADHCTYPAGGATPEQLVGKLKETTRSFMQADDQIGDLEAAIKKARQGHSRGT